MEGAEALYREAIATFERALGPAHLNTAIARIKLGRCLLRQGRAAEAEPETLAGYEVLAAQAEPSISWLQSAREDLARARALLGRDGGRDGRDEAEGAEPPPGSTGAAPGR